MNTTQEITYPGYTNFEMAIHECESQPKPIKMELKYLAKKHQKICEIVRWSEMRISKLEDENEKLKANVQELARAVARLEVRR